MILNYFQTGNNAINMPKQTVFNFGVSIYDKCYVANRENRDIFTRLAAEMAEIWK